MARAAKPPGDARKLSPGPSAPTFIGWFFRPAMLFRAAFVAGICALWPYAAQHLPKLDSRSEYKVRFDSIQLIPAPANPVPANLIEQIRELGDLPNEVSVLDDHLTIDIAQAFRQHPWVANVVRVRKSFPAAIVVEVEYRQPVAMVQVSGGRFPIDAKGVLLPSNDFTTAETNRFPLIQNVASKSKLRPGSVWNDPAVLAAARLAELLGDRWKSLKLDAICVPKVLNATTTFDNVPLELLGRGGSRILWGRPPGSDHPGELQSIQKIRRLENYLTEFADYAKPNGPYEIDIRHWQEISRRPLVTEQAQARPHGRNRR